MILAAGLGTRLRPLSDLLPKPALPVRGVPVIGGLLSLLSAHGFREVLVNLHHLPDRMQRAAEASCPAEVELRFSHEETLLGTGGGIRRAVDFLRGSDVCLVLGGDMLLDLDLTALISAHEERQRRVTLVLRDDPRAGNFGTIGIGEEGSVRKQVFTRSGCA